MPDNVLQEWRRALLSCTFSFKVLTNDYKRHWEGVQLRENLSQSYASLRRTALGRCYEIISFKQRVEKIAGQSGMSCKTIQKCYKDNVKMASNSEPITDNFIEISLRVYKNVLSHDTVAGILLACDDQLGIIPFCRILCTPMGRKQIITRTVMMQ